MAASTAKISQEMSVKDMKCPLCFCHAGDTRRAFENHVGKHMEEIALASLPKDAAEDSDVASEESRLGPSDPKPDPYPHSQENGQVSYGHGDGEADYEHKAEYIHDNPTSDYANRVPPDARVTQRSFESFSQHSRNALQEYHPYYPELTEGLGMEETQPQYPPPPWINEHKSPNFVGIATKKEQPSIKRDREPPRNSKNQIYCNHAQCAENPPIFRWPDEWK